MPTLIENGTDNITTTTEDYDDYDYVIVSTEPETIIGVVDKLSDVEAILLQSLVCGTVMAYVTFVAMLWVLGPSRKRSIECYLMLKHSIFGLLHQTCVTVSFVFFKEVEFQSLLTQVHNYITLSIPFWTLSLSIKAFVNQVLSRNVFSAKELTAFCYSSITIIQLYEGALASVLDVIEYGGPQLLVAIRMTSVTFVMCVSLSIISVIVFYLVKEPGPHTKRSHAALILLNILVLTMFDSPIVAFAAVSMGRDTTMKLIIALVLCTRLVLEIFWSTAFEYWEMLMSR